MASKVWVFFHTIWSTLHFFAFCYMFMLRCVPICCLWFLFSLNVQFCQSCTACVCYVHFTPSVNIPRCSFGISSLYVYLRATIWITRKLLFAQCCYLAKAPLQSQTVQSLPRSYYTCTYAFLFSLSLLSVCMYSGVWRRRLWEDSVHSEVPLWTGVGHRPAHQQLCHRLSLYLKVTACVYTYPELAPEIYCWGTTSPLATNCHC